MRAVISSILYVRRVGLEPTAIRDRHSLLCNILRIQLRQDGNLLLNIINFILCVFQVNNLDSDRAIGSSINSIRNQKHKKS